MLDPHSPAKSSTRTLLALLAALATTCGGADLQPEDSAAARHQQSAPSIDVARLAELVHDRVNLVREREGRRALAYNPALAKIAALHSVDMVRQRYFAHLNRQGQSFSRRYELAGFACKVPDEPPYYLLGAENLALIHRVAQWKVHLDRRKEPAQVRTLEHIAADAVQGWWDSPGHRKNLLTHAWLSEGIGVAVTADGQVLITQNFC